MDTREFYRQLTGIEAPWQVTDVSLDLEAGEVTLLVEHVGAGVACGCGRQCGVHDHMKERRWRHLGTCQLKTFIRCRLPRTRCDQCGVKTVEAPWAVPHGRLLPEYVGPRISDHRPKWSCGRCRPRKRESDGVEEMKTIYRRSQPSELAGVSWQNPMSAVRKGNGSAADGALEPVQGGLPYGAISGPRGTVLSHSGELLSRAEAWPYRILSCLGAI
jgi:hypothetical protein